MDQGAWVEEGGRGIALVWNVQRRVPAHMMEGVGEVGGGRGASSVVVDLNRVFHRVNTLLVVRPLFVRYSHVLLRLFRPSP